MIVGTLMILLVAIFCLNEKGRCSLNIYRQLLSASLLLMAITLCVEQFGLLRGVVVWFGLLSVLAIAYILITVPLMNLYKKKDQI